MLYAIIVVLLLIADQGLKYWVTVHVALNEGRHVLIPHVLDIMNIHNYGIAFSWLQNVPSWVFALIAALFAVVVILALRRGAIHGAFGRWMAVLALAGAIGNCIDRVLSGYVVDMLAFAFWKSFPVFNLADACLVVGGIAFCLYVIFHKEAPVAVQQRAKRRKASEQPKEAKAEAGQIAAAEKKPAAKRQPKPEAAPAAAAKPKTAPAPKKQPAAEKPAEEASAAKPKTASDGEQPAEKKSAEKKPSIAAVLAEKRAALQKTAAAHMEKRKEAEARRAAEAEAEKHVAEEAAAQKPAAQPAASSDDPFAAWDRAVSEQDARNKAEQERKAAREAQIRADRAKRKAEAEAAAAAAAPAKPEPEAVPVPAEKKPAVDSAPTRKVAVKKIEEMAAKLAAKKPAEKPAEKPAPVVSKPAAPEPVVEEEVSYDLEDILAEFRDL